MIIILGMKSTQLDMTQFEYDILLKSHSQRATASETQTV